MGVCTVPLPWWVLGSLRNREEYAPPGALVDVSMRMLIQTLCCVVTTHMPGVHVDPETKSWGYELAYKHSPLIGDVVSLGILGAQSPHIEWCLTLLTLTLDKKLSGLKSPRTTIESPCHSFGLAKSFRPGPREPGRLLGSEQSSAMQLHLV